MPSHGGSPLGRKPYGDEPWTGVSSSSLVWIRTKNSIAVAVCEAGREPCRFVGPAGSDLQEMLKHGASQQVRVVCEAGPPRCGLYGALSQRGYRCEINAPSLIPRRAGERIKTDRCDCARLAELSRVGELKAIWVPGEAHEAMRNLCRARRRGQHAPADAPAVAGVSAAPGPPACRQDVLAQVAISALLNRQTRSL